MPCEDRCVMSADVLEPVETARQRHVVVTFSGLLLAMLLAALDGTIVATALPVVASQLGGIDRISWVVTAYLLAETLVTPVWGNSATCTAENACCTGHRRLRRRSASCGAAEPWPTWFCSAPFRASAAGR